MKIPLLDVWNIFRISLVFHIWKTQNKIMFQNQQDSISFTLANKIEIFLETWFHICIQVAKVEMEVNHIHTLLVYWANSPCSLSQMAPDFSQ